MIKLDEEKKRLEKEKLEAIQRQKIFKSERFCKTIEDSLLMGTLRMTKFSFGQLDKYRFSINTKLHKTKCRKNFKLKSSIFSLWRNHI
jgi:hypothetical protein